jgi:hypothetical protein
MAGKQAADTALKLAGRRLWGSVLADVELEEYEHQVLVQACQNYPTVRRRPRIRPHGLIDRGSHVLKGKSATVQVFGLQTGNGALSGLCARTLIDSAAALVQNLVKSERN